MTSESEFRVEEIEIPVPWGQISGKVWGEESGSPVIVLHGLLDNCGSFDRLIPMLPDTFRYYCIDLPGHGRSSHFPNGIPIEFFNYVLSVRYVVDHLKLPYFYIIGHSFGAQVCILFSSIYPERVTKIVCLDGILPEAVPLKKTVERCKQRLNNIHDGIAGKTPPNYTFDEALERLLKNRFSQLTEEAGRVMIKRSLIPSSSGYKFSSDQRLKGIWRVPLTLEQLGTFLTSVRCPILLILAKDTQTKYERIYGEYYLERLAALVYGAIDIRVTTVEGNHDVHLNNPERVYSKVSSFLLELKSNL